MAEAPSMSTRGTNSNLSRASAPSTSSVADAGAISLPQRQRRDDILYYFFIVQAIAVTVLQKIGITFGADAVVPVVVPVMLGGLAITIFLVPPVLEAKRIVAVGLFFVASLIGTAFAPTYSGPSVFLLVALYTPLAITFPTTERNFQRCMNFFSSLMVTMAGITIIQLFIEMATSWMFWPDLDTLLPQAALVPGFNYIQPIISGSGFMKPNAIFFLEVSFLSQYLAIALAIEIVLFQRIWRIALFTGVLFGCFAGTGLLLLALTLPVLLGRLEMRYMALVIIGLVFVALGALELGWLDMVAQRIGEYRYGGSSANMRFVAPLDRLVHFLSTPNSLYTGIGAGQIEKANNYQWWPITKATVEYGAITGTLLYAMIFYTLFNRPPYRRLAFMLLVWFSIEGALLTAVNPYTCALLSSLFVIDRTSRRGRHSASSNAERTKADNEGLDYNRRRRRRRSDAGTASESVAATRELGT